MITLKENMRLVYDHKVPEFMPFMTDFNSAFLVGMDFVNERPEVPGVNKDWFGQSWTWEELSSACNPTPGCHLLKDITQWRDVIKFPDLDKLDWEGHAAKDTANWDRENKFSRITIGFGLWERLFSIMNFEDALCALIEEPEACYDFFGAIADHKIRLHELAIKHYKPDVLIMHDDYGNHKNLFMSPKSWRELIKPHLKRIVDSVQSQGVIYEHHNCGYFESIIEDMLEIGIGATNPVHISNNLANLKKNYGDRMVMVGALDIQMYGNLNVTEDDIRKNIRDTFALMAPGGGFIPMCAVAYSKFDDVINDEMVQCAKLYYGPRPDEGAKVDLLDAGIAVVKR
ncbi:hypothetical protein NXH76_15615 [Blautia schinkii]|nr:hypothetical protein [Blautia schinkii]